MKILVKTVLATLATLLLIYLFIPTKNFPEPAADWIQSSEPGDTETPLRRAYFTNLDREEIISYYQSLYPYSLRLNYPPEDAQTLIRDQTRSTFLEELVYPLRESIYINGFKPSNPKDDIWYQGRHFRQKIIIKYSPSSLQVRLIIGILVLSSAYILINGYKKSIK